MSSCMRADANHTIRLSESETQMLTRALAEAAAQAAVESEAVGETQFVRRSDTEVQRKVGDTDHATGRPGNMIL